MPRELSLAEIFQVGYYWETKILLTAAKLDIFSVLNDTSMTAADLAERCQLDCRGVDCLDECSSRGASAAEGWGSIRQYRRWTEIFGAIFP